MFTSLIVSALASSFAATSTASTHVTPPAPLKEYHAGDLVVTNSSDFRGCLIHVGDNEVQLDELLYGVDAENTLIIAFARGTTLSGQPFHVDNRAKARETFADLSNARGIFFYVGEDKRRVYAEEPVWGRSVDGHVTVLSLAGYTEAGQARGHAFRSDDTQPICHTAIQSVDCKIKVCVQGCNPVKIDPQTGEPVCNCSAPGGTCEVIYPNVCPADGLCPSGTVCKNKLSNTAECECR